jgi:hypothetical protein
VVNIKPNSRFEGERKCQFMNTGVRTVPPILKNWFGTQRMKLFAVQIARGIKLFEFYPLFPSPEGVPGKGLRCPPPVVRLLQDFPELISVKEPCVLKQPCPAFGGVALRIMKTGTEDSEVYFRIKG